MQAIMAHYDGKVIVPDEPVHLAIGQRVRLRVEVVDSTEGPFADLARFATDVPDAPPDLSLQHDHYLYGTPKK